jgi:Tfp pilus assembly protein PilF
MAPRIPNRPQSILFTAMTLAATGCASHRMPVNLDKPVTTADEPTLRANYRAAMAAGGNGGADAAYALASSYWRGHEPDSARVCLEQAVHMDPHHPASLAWLSRLYYEAGEIERGIALLEPEAAADSASHPEILTNLALLKLAWGEPEAASALLQRSITAHPGYAPAYGNLGYLRLQSGELDQAGENLARAIELDGSVPEYHNNLGIVHRKQQQFAAAAHDFERAVALDDTFREAHHNLALLYKLYLPDEDKARAHFRRFLALGGQADPEVAALFLVQEKTP